jgi:PAS domain S-box-containing protein
MASYEMRLNGNILIADDDPQCVSILSDALRADGWEVTAASNGAQALAREPRPRLILLGIGLPAIGGLEVCRLLKSNQATWNIPVILIVEAGAFQDGIKGLALGAVDFIEKPFRRGALPAALRTHLELERIRIGIEQGAARVGSGLERALLMLQSGIAGWRRTEAARRENEELSSLALSAGKTYTFEWSPKTGVLRRWPRPSGAPGTSDSAPAGTWTDYLQRVYPDDRENLTRRIAALTVSNDTCEVDYRVSAPDDRVAYRHAVIRAFFDEAGHPERYIGMAVDTTRSSSAPPGIGEREEGFRHLADVAPMMICASGPDMRATYFNDAWLTFAGRTLAEESGYGWTSRLHPDDVDGAMANYSASFAAREKCHIEYRLRRADGEYRWIICSGVPRWSEEGVFAGYIASCLDITDIRRAQEEAFDTQKLESLRALTGRIAHDFNNLLGGILVQAELSEEEIAEGASPADSIDRIRKLAAHASDVVRELLIYSGREDATVEPINLSRIVREMTELLKASISKRAKLQTDLAADLPTVLGSTTQMRQLVMNLILNASEAIGEQEGTIRVTTAKNIGVGGKFILLKVADTGRGMTAEARGRIFDPFYTTKAAGHGLGLAIVHGIARSHGGEVRVSSAPGLGTTFEVLLPCLGDALRRPAHSVALPLKSPAPRYGTVLLVDEDESFRVSIGKALRARGISVLSVADGRSAVEVFQTHQADIGAVVLSVTAQAGPSPAISEQVQRFRPAPVILACAAGETADQVAGIEHALPTLERPYRIEHLIALLEQVAGPVKPAASETRDPSRTDRTELNRKANRGSGN